jgi:hypothetical protein
VSDQITESQPSPNIESGFHAEHSLSNTHKSRNNLFVVIFIIIFASLLWIGSLIYQNYQLKNEIISLKKSSVESSFQPSSKVDATSLPQSDGALSKIGDCSEEECLFDGGEAIEGLGKMTGYYHPYTKDNWGEQDTCEAIIVEKGSQALLDDLINTVKKGNGINSLTDSGQLILNIEPKQTQLTVIKKSTKDNPVTLTVVRNSPQGRGADGCISFVSILKVE